MAAVGMAAGMEATAAMHLLTTHLGVVASMRSTPTGVIWLTTRKGTIWRIWRISMQTAISISLKSRPSTNSLMSRRSIKLRAITYWPVITSLARIFKIGC
jgi:hypothetical protein